MSMEWQGSSRLGATNNITIATTSTAGASSAFGSQTRQIRVAAPAACFLKVGDGTPTAATSDAYIAPNWPEYITVTPGQKASVYSATLQTVSIVEIA